MKKKMMVLLSAVLAVLCLASCKDPVPPVPPAPPEPVLRRSIQRGYEGNALAIVIESEYDENGNVVRQTSKSDEETVQFVMEFAYDAAGNLVLQKGSNAAGQLIMQFEYEFDSHGNQTKRVQKASDGSILAMEESIFEYNGASQPVKITYKTGSILDYWCELTYDTNGRLIRETDKNPNGTPEGEMSGYREYVYSANGYTEYEKDSSGATVSFNVYENGLLVRYEESSGDSVVYTYDAGGNLINQSQYSDTGDVFMKLDYTYDENGNPVEMLEQDYDSVAGQWVVFDWIKCEFDSAGNLLKETALDTSEYPLEVPEAWTAYEYIYE